MRVSSRRYGVVVARRIVFKGIRSFENYCFMVQH